MSSPRARAAVLWNASHLASERGQHREALELAEEALAYFRHGSDRRSAARLLSQYGYLLLRQEPPRVDEARSTLEEALAILREHGARYELGYVLTELSRAYLLKGEVAGAVDAAEQSLDELGPEAALERARAATALAAALAANGARDRAAELFTTAAETLGQMKTSRQAARAWVELGEMLVQAGDPAAAVDAFRKATVAMNLGAAPAPASRSPLASP
jgi:tetratricopeptide (TPR) repeat protein